MNERIKELAIESQLAELYDRYMHYCIKNSDDDILDFDEVVNNFAELIIQECLEVVEKQTGGGNGDGVEWDRAVDFTYNDIKSYFGVEE
jgi:hypothetical protein